jgi:TonB family protein
MPNELSGARRLGLSLSLCVLVVGAVFSVPIHMQIHAQSAAPPQQPVSPSTPAPTQQPAATQAAAPHPAPVAAHDEPAITEWELRQQLLGKTFYLRGGYLENDLHFTSDGKLDGSSPRASHTLSLVEIESVHLEKHKLALEGVRYGVHFLGALASEDQSSATDKVRLTTKKKPLKIEIDREAVDTSFEKKQEKQEQKAARAARPAATVPAQPAATAEPAAPAQAASTQPLPATENNHREATVATSTAQANAALRNGLDHIFAPGIDDRMIASLPAYWQLYYKALAAKADYRPSDASVLRQSQVDQKAKLLQAFDPPSNEYAQTNGIVGLAMYHVVVGADGKPAEIAIGRPIGFGLDENAVESIRKATFQPAIKQGQPVPVLVDLTVQFRIYSKMTSTPAPAPADAGKPQTPTSPAPTSSAPSQH